MKTFGKLLVLFVFVFAIYLLYQKLQSYSLAEIKQSLGQIPARSIVMAFFFMILNYIVLVGYDWLALKAIKKSLPLSKVSLVSFVGSVVGANFGAILGGSTVRYRLYSLWGFTPLEVIRLVVMVGFTFWVGAMGISGILFIFVPLELPDELGMSFISVRPLGFFLLFVCIAYHVVCWWADGKSVYIRGKEFALPPFKIAIVQTFIAGLDLMIAAACLYSLLPSAENFTFFGFLPNYLLGQIAAVLTHVPGGAGVLEVVIMNLVTDIPASSVFAAILAFRVIYYLIPLLFASVLLGLNEVRINRRKEPETADKDIFDEWFLTVMKYAVFAVGVIFSLSVVLPVTQSTAYITDADYNIVTLFAYFMRGVVGVFLIIFAYGLDRKQKNHWFIVVISLFVGLICGFLSGGGWYESLMILAVLFPLLVSSKKFTRQRVLLASHYPLAWLITSIGMFVIISILTVFFTSLTNRDRAWENFFEHGYIEYYALSVELLTGITIFIMLILADKYKKRRNFHNENN